MEKVTIEELRKAPESIERYVQSGETVRVTKQGAPFFDAVPVRTKSRFEEFVARIDGAWKQSAAVRSTAELLEGLRDSRE